MNKEQWNERIDVLQVGNAYLCCWGRWAAKADVTKLGYGVNALAIRANMRTEPVNDVGEVVDRALARLPEEYRQLAVLVWQRQWDIKPTARHFECSCRTINERLAQLRLVAFCAVDQKNN